MAGLKTALVVADSPVMRFLIKTVIEETHPQWRVLEATDAAGALKAATRARFDVVLIDLQIPGIQGIELAERLQTKFPAASLSLITACHEPTPGADVEKLGFGMIPKPFDAAKIREALG